MLLEKRPKKTVYIDGESFTQLRKDFLGGPVIKTSVLPIQGTWV